jgi:hypothetical protein
MSVMRKTFAGLALAAAAAASGTTAVSIAAPPRHAAPIEVAAPAVCLESMVWDGTACVTAQSSS